MTYPPPSPEGDPVVVRRASLSDAAGIATVHVAAWKVAYVDLVPQWFLDGLSVQARTASWRDILALERWPREGCLVLEAAEGVVGFASFGADRDGARDGRTGEIMAVYLAPDRWDRGAGRRLMASALDCLRAGGYDQAVLWVLDTNDRARRFYQAGGWEPDGTEKIDDRRGFSLRELRYWRALERPGAPSW
jgi:GNAT superfamily N-acetyltransferase